MHYFLAGDALKKVLSLDPEFLNKHFSEQIIAEYKPDNAQLDHDLSRAGKISFTNLLKEKDFQIQEYIYGKIKRKS